MAFKDGTTLYIAMFRHADFDGWYIAGYRGEFYVSDNPDTVIEKAKEDLDDSLYFIRAVPFCVPSE